jgi:hypothetical protein
MKYRNYIAILKKRYAFLAYDLSFLAAVLLFLLVLIFLTK